jgi:hypothetical protein
VVDPREAGEHVARLAGLPDGGQTGRSYHERHEIP